jgi:hypothetical protein
MSRVREDAESDFSSGIPATGMERLWSLAGATNGNRWQMEDPRKRLNQAKTVATSCDQLPWDLDGKEGVDGSSPSEGFDEMPASGHRVLPPTATTEAPSQPPVSLDAPHEPRSTPAARESMSEMTVASSRPSRA